MSCGLLPPGGATLAPCRTGGIELSVALGPDGVGAAVEKVLRRDIAESAVKADMVVVLHDVGDDLPGLLGA
jgi:hypothetical protein